jgi:hypothetical protein
VQAARGKFAIEAVGRSNQSSDQATAIEIIRTSLAYSIEDILLIAAALALGAAACGMLLPSSKEQSKADRRPLSDAPVRGD